MTVSDEDDIFILLKILEKNGDFQKNNFDIEIFEILEQKVDQIKKAEWDIKVPDLKVKGKEWLKSQVSRAFLPNYFDQYKKYLYYLKFYHYSLHIEKYYY